MSDIANPDKYSVDATVTREGAWFWSARGVWLGAMGFAVSLVGTELLRAESLRILAVLLLVGAGILAVLAWSDSQWFPVFPENRATGFVTWHVTVGRKRSSLALLAGAVFLSALSHVAFLATPRATFGLAGWLWIVAIALIIAAAVLQSSAASPGYSRAAGLPGWSWWEIAIVVSITILALGLRISKLRDVPFNIYPDEVMTGLVSERAYLNGASPAPSLFSTLWSDIDLPALWFAIVAGVLKLGGIGLATVRLPAALFGAATVLPFYGLVRGVWGRVAAIAGASVMAFSAVNVHYSRMALSNITTPFFWTVCFFFLMRGLRSRRPADWTLAGLAAGISEHFYYGTRLLPFILVSFVVYLLVVHWIEAKRYITQLGWLALGYLIGFGPLLSYFVTHPGLYYGRGAGLMTWNRIPATWHDLQQMWTTLWPIMSENLLGISTRSSQDIMYFAPLLLAAEAALLVLGVALLIWRWRHPVAFLLLLSGIGVLLVGGTLVLYPNSSPPMLAHWTPALPFFYAAIAVPIGAWVTSARALPRLKSRWITASAVTVGLAILGYANIRFYFFNYYADPETLKTERYKAAQRLYEEQTVQSRYMASLGSAYRVVVVGRSPYPYDMEITRYLVQGQEFIVAYDPQTQPPLAAVAGKGAAFLFFPGSEQYLDTIRERCPGGSAGEVRNPVGRHVFNTYVVGPEMLEQDARPH
ncbi:MAG TPA: glycosyltransferase family 39 protein [Candidatus Udaeobacter sp.]|nr:glycosyltransferase family 39 protein [Candidatus Udaeobacter sp.]